METIVDKYVLADGKDVPYVMTAQHRCDRCQSRAYVRVVLFSDQVLDFCGHHYRIHHEALKLVSSAIRDETQALHNK